MHYKDTVPETSFEGLDSPLRFWFPTITRTCDSGQKHFRHFQRQKKLHNPNDGFYSDFTNEIIANPSNNIYNGVFNSGLGLFCAYKGIL